MLSSKTTEAHHDPCVFLLFAMPYTCTIKNTRESKLNKFATLDFLCVNLIFLERLI